MTDHREYYASTVDEAVDKATADLGVTSEELVFKVLDEGSAGFLGMGSRDARIAVEVQEARQADVSDQAAETTAPPSSSDPVAAEAYPPEPPEAVEPPAEEGQYDAPEDLLDEVRELVSSVLAAMDFQAGVDVYDAGGYIAADVTPDNTALFIGQKGETIDALQYLVNVAIYKERPFAKRVVLDAEGYRQRRVEALQGMAHRTARRAVREHRAVELPPMNSAERRVVHLFLQDNPGVTTQSEGTGDNRRVRVLPV